MTYLRLVLLLAVIMFSGCAKGALWRLGYLSPQARQQWAEEEQYAKTWPTQKAEMTAMVKRANLGGAAEQQRVAGQLATILQEDRRTMVRIHAADLLSNLPADAARRATILATEDAEADVRITACQTLAQFGDSDSLLQLQRVLGSDTNADVRIAATRAIGEYKSAQAAQALALAIDSDSPALQLAAADSLEKCTGEKFGHDIPKWEQYLADTRPSTTTGTKYPAATVSHEESGGMSLRKLFQR